MRPLTYCEGLANALLRLQDAVAVFRNILFNVQQRRHINAMTRIITDLTRHIGILNYLHTKAGCTV